MSQWACWPWILAPSSQQGGHQPEQPVSFCMGHASGGFGQCLIMGFWA